MTDKLIILNWSEMISLEKLTRYNKFVNDKGVYLHFLKYGDKYRIIYVGSGWIYERNSGYYHAYTSKYNSRYSTWNLKYIDDPYSFYCNSDIYEKFNKSNFVLGGSIEYETKGISDEEFYRIRTNNANNIYVSIAIEENKYKRAESIIQKYLIEKFGMVKVRSCNSRGPKHYLIGFNNTSLHDKSEYEVKNIFNNDKIFDDLKSENNIIKDRKL